MMYDNSLEQKLIDRLDKNLADFKTYALSLDKEDIFKLADKISAMVEMCDYLKNHYPLDDPETEYLLNFHNPLEVCADRLLQRDNDWDDLEALVDDICDKQDVLNDYSLVSDMPKEKLYLQKFENVDILSTLKAIANQNIVYYPNDIKADMELIPKFAASVDSELKMLLWHVSSYGTHIIPERDTFLMDTGQYNTWVNYLRPGMLSYAVEITGMENGVVKGNVYELNHEAHVDHVKNVALPTHTVTISYEDGRKNTVSHYEFDKDRNRLMSESGNVINTRFHPKNESVLASILQREQHQRDETPTGNFKSHLKSMADNLVKAEAERIVTEFNGKTEPDSPNKTHFVVPLSREFMFLASSKDQDRLFDALPYKSKVICNLKDEKGLFVTVNKDELLKQPEKNKKLSVMAQLEQAAKDVKPPVSSNDAKRKATEPR